MIPADTPVGTIVLVKYATENRIGKLIARDKNGILIDFFDNGEQRHYPGWVSRVVIATPEEIIRWRNTQ